jgi:hypothetical protein
MVRSFCAKGNHETIKCGVHGAVGVLVGMCAVYNFTAWCFRRDRHLSINAAIYTLAVIWEFKHTVHHMEACVPVRSEPGRGTPPLALVEEKAA